MSRYLELQYRFEAIEMDRDEGRITEKEAEVRRHKVKQDEDEYFDEEEKSI